MNDGTEYQVPTVGARSKYTLLIFASKKAMRLAGTRQYLSIIRPIMKKNPSKSYDFDGFWSEWGDSNSRHLAPKASALPTALHPVMKLFYLWSFMWS